MSILRFVGTSASTQNQVGVGVSSIVGPTGPQGTQGFNGFIGTTGPQGFQGWQGISGFSTNTGAQGWQGPQGSNVWFQTGTSIYYTGGNVGIGNDYPQYPLDIRGTARIGSPSSPQNYLIHLGLTGANANYRSAYIYGDGTDMTFNNQQSGSIIFATNNANKVYFTNKSQYLFGTIYPISTGSLTGTMIISKPPAGLTVEDSYYIGLGSGEYNPTGASYRLIGLGYRNQLVDRYWPSYIGYLTNTDAGRSNGHIVFGTRGDTTDVEPIERARIMSDGYFCVGSTGPSPASINAGTQFPTLTVGTNIKTGTQVGGTVNVLGTHPLFYTTSYPTASNTNRPVIVMNRPGTNYAAIGVNDQSSTNSGLWIGETNYLGSTGGISYPYIYIKNGGNVGINTTNPSYKFTVLTSGAAWGMVHSNDLITMGTYLESNVKAWFGTQSNHSLSFFTNNASPQMILTTAGNVGIGTLTPGSTLEVYGTIFSGETGPLILRKTAGYGVALAPTPFLVFGEPDLDKNFNLVTSYALRYGGVGGAGTDGKMYISSVKSSSYVGKYSSSQTFTDLVTIDGSGFVGIGTTGPSSKLHVLSTSASEPIAKFEGSSDTSIQLSATGGSNEVYIEFHNQGNSNTNNYSWGVGQNDDQNLHFKWGGIGTMNGIMDAMTLYSQTGLVGISTTSSSPAQAKLDVINRATQYTAFEYDQNAFMIGTGKAVSDEVLYMGVNTGSNAYSYIQSVNVGVAPSSLYLNCRGGNVVTNIVGGNVGIGTGSPLYKLSIYDTTNNAIVDVQNDSVGNTYSALRLRNKGSSVGILFMNSTTSAIEGGANAMTLRNDAGILRLQDSTSNGITISSGNVGVRTSSPTTALDVNGTIHQSSSGISNDTYMRAYNSYYSTGYTFYATSSVQTLTTSATTTSIEIECWGAGGGSAGIGGNGGYSKCVMTGLTGAQTMKIWVGDVGEGGRSYVAPVIDCTLLSQANFRYPNPPVLASDTSIGWYVTGAPGSQTYYLATCVGPGFYEEQVPIQNRYSQGLTYPAIYNGGTEIQWSANLTGTIYQSGSYPINGYGELCLKYYEIFWYPNSLAGKSYIIYTNTGLNTFQPTYSTGDSGGGASFVYLQTGSSYQLLSVAGGGGGAGVSNNQTYFPLESDLFAEYLGANSQTSAQNDLASAYYFNWFNWTGTNLTSIFGQGGQNNIGGAGGTSNTGTINLGGGSGMPLLTSSVTTNLSCVGGTGSYIKIGFGDSWETLYTMTGTTMFLTSAGGGGRGFGGGGGGATQFYIFTGPLLDMVEYYQQNNNYTKCTGDCGGGGGGGNYSFNGTGFIQTNGFNYGDGYEAPYCLAGSPGLVKITVYGLDLPSFSISPETNSNFPSLYQTKGLTVGKDGSLAVSNRVAIGKANAETMLDVLGDTRTIGNITIPNYQNIFKSQEFDPILNQILENNFNYSTSQETVSLNYSLASLSLNIGYVENALSGLVTALTYAFGTYDENGDISDVPAWLKNWIINFLPVSSASLTNYITSQLTSSNPTRQYYLSQGILLPFGEFTVKLLLSTNPSVFSRNIFGAYIENGNFYIFTNSYYSGNLANAAKEYVVNSVIATDNLKLLNEYNSPTGSYKFNITSYANAVYPYILNNFGTVTQDLVMYTNYYYPWSTDVLPYDPNSFYVNTVDALLLYNPSSELSNPNANYWANHVFYDFFQYYTGDYSGGYFIGGLRPLIPRFAEHNKAINDEIKMKLDQNPDYLKEVVIDSEKVMKYVMNFRATAVKSAVYNNTTNVKSSAAIKTTKGTTSVLGKMGTSISGSTIPTSTATQQAAFGTPSTVDNTKRVVP